MGLLSKSVVQVFVSGFILLAALPAYSRLANEMACGRLIKAGELHEDGARSLSIRPADVILNAEKTDRLDLQNYFGKGSRVAALSIFPDKATFTGRVNDPTVQLTKSSPWSRIFNKITVYQSGEHIEKGLSPNAPSLESILGIQPLKNLPLMSIYKVKAFVYEGVAAVLVILEHKAGPNHPMYQSHFYFCKSDGPDQDLKVTDFSGFKPVDISETANRPKMAPIFESTEQTQLASQQILNSTVFSQGAQAHAAYKVTAAAVAAYVLAYFPYTAATANTVLFLLPSRHQYAIVEENGFTAQNLYEFSRATPQQGAQMLKNPGFKQYVDKNVKALQAQKLIADGGA